jgi:hypothetical protein
MGRHAGSSNDRTSACTGGRSARPEPFAAGHPRVPPPWLGLAIGPSSCGPARAAYGVARTERLDAPLIERLRASQVGHASSQQPVRRRTTRDSHATQEASALHRPGPPRMTRNASLGGRRSRTHPGHTASPSDDNQAKMTSGPSHRFEREGSLSRRLVGLWLRSFKAAARDLAGP